MLSTTQAATYDRAKALRAVGQTEDWISLYQHLMSRGCCETLRGEPMKSSPRGVHSAIAGTYRAVERLCGATQAAVIAEAYTNSRGEYAWDH